MRPKSNPNARFRRLLTAWYRRAARDLPWRRTRDAYPVAVSEFMLQQTPVSRVLDYYPRFLEQFPTVRHLASARPKAVREAWDGLGYYRRAANLHRLARDVVRDYDGELPSDISELRKLPGVGPYTAGAIAESLQPRAGKAAWTFSQALMELGALICVARKPRCGICPVRSACPYGGKIQRDEDEQPGK